VIWQVVGASRVDVTTIQVAVPSVGVDPRSFDFNVSSGVIDESFSLCFGDYDQFANEDATFQLVDTNGALSNIVTEPLPDVIDECAIDNGGCGNPSVITCTNNPGNRPTCAPVGGVPAEWTCNADFYGVADGCDCGCGVVDLDCADATIASCEFSGCATGLEPDPDDTTTCRDTNECLIDNGGCGDESVFRCVDNPGAPRSCVLIVPEEWTCAESIYGTNDGCDCGCGVVDLDCPDATIASCGFSGCATGFEPDPDDTTTCRDTNECLIDNGGCGDSTVIACINNPGAPRTCEPVGGVPAEWTCNADFYGVADGCDCGCGAVDADCADADFVTCDFSGCPEPTTVDPNDTTQCL
jgi:hypothetical protein